MSGDIVCEGTFDRVWRHSCLFNGMLGAADHQLLGRGQGSDTLLKKH